LARLRFEKSVGSAISRSSCSKRSRLRPMRESKSISKKRRRRVCAISVRDANQLRLLGSASGLGAAVTACELLHAPGRIDELLFASEKRMTSGADTDSNITARRAGMINRAARAHDIRLVILWMNVCFHLRKGARNVITHAHSRKR